MASRIAEAYVQIVPTTSGIEGALTKQLGGAGNNAGKEMGNGIVAGAKSFVGPLVAVFAVAGVANFTKDLVTSALEGQKVDATVSQIAKSMGLFGSQTDAVVKRVQDLATQQMRLTGVDDDVIKAGQAKLLTFREVAATAGTAGGAFDRATKASLDLAAAGFGSVESASVMLGKALNDPIAGVNALRRVGVQLTDEQKNQIESFMAVGDVASAQAVILGEVERQVGGVAAASATSVEKLKANWDDALQGIGTLLLPAFDAVVNGLNDFIIPALISFSENIGPIFSKMGEYLKPFADAFKTSLAPAISTLVPVVAQLWANFSPLSLIFQALTPVLPILGELLGTIANLFATQLATVLPVVAEIFQKIVGAVSELLAALIPLVAEIITAVLPVIMSLIPVVLDLANVFADVLAAILPIVVELLGEIVDFIMPILIPVIQILGEVFKFVVTLIAEIIKWLWQYIVEPIFNLIVDIIGVLGDVFTWLWENAVEPVFNFIGDIFEWIWNYIIKPVIDGIILYIKVWGAIFTWLYENAIKPAFDAIGRVFDFLWKNVIKPGVDLIVAIFTGLGKIVETIFGGIGSFIRTTFEAVVGFVKAPINAIIGLLNGMIDGLNKIKINVPDWVPVLGGKTIGFNLARIPMLAAGGVISGSGSVMVGEEGPERHAVA